MNPYPALLVAIGFLLLPRSASGQALGGQEPERDPVIIEPGSDVGHSPRARWTRSGGLALEGAAGATMQVDHAIMVRPHTGPVSTLHISVDGAPAAWIRSYMMEIHRNGTLMGVLGATAPHSELDFTNVTAGELDISATLDIAEDAPTEGVAMGVFSVRSTP